MSELDPELALSEGHRAEMLLDLTGLDKRERPMVQASIGNVRDFDKILEALVVQHPRIHLKSTTLRPKGGSKGHGKMKGKRVKGKFSKGKKGSHWRNPFGFAHIAAEEWGDDVAYNADMAEGDPYSDPAHW